VFFNECLCVQPNCTHAFELNAPMSADKDVLYLIVFSICKNAQTWQAPAPPSLLASCPFSSRVRESVMRMFQGI